MSNIEIKNDIFKTELPEQREQSNIHGGIKGSLNVPTIKGNGNKLITKIENPLNNPSKILAQLGEIKRPCYLSIPNEFELHNQKMKAGVYHFRLDNNGAEINEWICSPLTVEAITSSTNDDEYGSLLKFMNSNGRWREWAMPRRMLKSNGGEELLGELLDQGFTYNPKKRHDIVNYIMNAKPIRRITAASTVGWHGESFVLPNQVIGKQDVVFQSEIAGESEFTKAGTMDGWKQEIGRYCVDNIPLMVSISAAIAGPLLKLLNRQQGGAIHWVGDSSSGKSTVAEDAASVWGSPDMMRSWSATANGLEGVAATRNDNCLILDEIGEAQPFEIGKIIYLLMNGYGKQRAGRIGNARKIQRWRIFAISTGEQTLSGKLSEIGKKPHTGQDIRLLSIPAKFEYGVFSNLHGFKDGRQLSDHLKEARTKHYGHLGPAFVHHLISEKKDLLELFHKIVQKISEHAFSNIEKRAAATFGIIGLAGELAIGYGLLPWEAGSGLDAVLEAFKRWQGFQGKAQSEDERILYSIRDFINRFGDCRFSTIHDDRPVTNRAGYYKGEINDARIYMFFPTTLQEVGGGFERSRIVEALDKAGWIVDKDSDGRFTKKTYIKGAKSSLYHICIKEEQS